MSEANREIVRRAHRALFGDGDLDLADELVHPDYLNHEAAEGRPRGPEGMRETVTWLRETFGNPQFEEQDLIAEGDRVVARVLFKGTLTGEVMGMAPTGKPFAVQHIHIWRIEDGKIAEHWACRDDVGAMRQTGLIPDKQLAG